MKYTEYLSGTATLLEQNRRIKGMHAIKILDREFLTSPHVFSPRCFADTEIFAQHIPVKPGESLLEIGCGIGAVGIFAALKGASRVVLSDINRKACEIAKINAKKHGVENIVETRYGNLFTVVREEEQFDSAFWNVPFGFVQNRRLSMLERAVFDPNYGNIRQFITKGQRYAKRLIIGFSTTLGKLPLLEQFCRTANLRLRLIHREKSKEIYPVNFELYEAR